MEQKDIDIYEILKDEEYGTELYTPKCGRVWHSGMANDKDSAKAIRTEEEAGRREGSFHVQESAAGSASGMAARKQKRIIGREFNNRVFNQRGQKGMAPYQNK